MPGVYVKLLVEENGETLREEDRSSGGQGDSERLEVCPASSQFAE